ncbi:YcaQ family DNA glycosylase [Ideonella sp. 4Y16]|uniref:DNA glycosylase AlkZ-like family protein n=1 Tax=Ideonella alba TaxID=2824118 RepID=UPI001B368FE3|nr:crosslink repair DNA glycosylase YcaQ family protein [Ideonella alba]MBQ0945401.1 YcaQ family DNA glycosylase [Ideonella alba]
MPATPTLDDLTRYAIARSLGRPSTLPAALQRLGFVQADPIRAPARAQDLTLRHRVKDYRAGELEQRYPRLKVEEDFFINYGFVTPTLHTLMHPRQARQAWPASRWTQAREVLAFVQDRGVVHPRAVDAHFQHGKTRNWFGGSSNASTQLLDGMHYRGLLRVARREGGIRLYAARPVTPPHEDPAAAMDALVDVVVGKYAPLPATTLSHLVARLVFGAPQWQAERAAALRRAKARLASAEVEGTRWYWPAGENPTARRWAADEALRLLAPFDPIVWDRPRFERFWGWAYRFEAYTPAPKRQRGYYALPMLWQGRVIGWGNLAVADGRLQAELGYVDKRPRGAAFTAALDDELQRLAQFLGLD